jgi:preprotein translocase subunit SecE
MSLDDLNREQKRALRRQGALDEHGAPTRAPRVQTRRERVGPVQYLREVRDEMRKVAWPTRPEVINYSIIVLVAVVILTAYIASLDFAFGEAIFKLFER